MAGPGLLTEVGELDAVLRRHEADLGGDFVGYRNHAYRVVNLCAALVQPDRELLDRLVIAAAFHDLGIWTDRTFDYLAPSIRLAGAYLAATGRGDWAPAVTAMIRDHHKLSPSRAGGLAEPFRRADWADVTLGVIRYEIPRPMVRAISAAFPDAGFHRRLLLLGLKRFCTHPWSPLPMLRL